MSNGKNNIAPITCSNETIKKEGKANRFWRINPSKLQRNAAKMTARAGRYFFIRRNYSLYRGDWKPIK
jgi:hypothetical protein